MSLERVQRLVNALLYEGYLLYPYRPSSVKNRRRFNFGVLVPPAYSESQSGTEACGSQTECIVQGCLETRLDMRVRFLQLDGASSSWQTATEREVSLLNCTLHELERKGDRLEFQFPPLAGVVDIAVRMFEHDLYRITVQVSNHSRWQGPEPQNRDEILPDSLLSTHTILTTTDGRFISLLDPPDEFRAAVSQCRNIGTWPVLAGEPGACDVMLSSPIILYDYPQIAPESPGDLFDGGEIDEILTLRILAMTEEEKQEMRQADERARQILERTEMLPQDQLMKLHGALRGLHAVAEKNK